MKLKFGATLRIYWQHMREYPWAVVFVIIGITIALSTELYRPLIYKQVIDSLVTDDRSDITYLLSLIYTLVAIGGLNWLGWRMAMYGDIFLVSRVMTNLLNTCYSYIQNHSYSFFSNTFVGSLVRKVNRYSKAYEVITDQIVWNIWPTVFSVIFVLVVLYRRHWLLSLILFVWIIIYLIFNYFFIRYKIPFDIARAETDSETSAHLADTITNNMNVKLFGNLGREVKTYRKITQKLRDLRYKGWSLDSLAESIQAGLMWMLEIGILYAAVRYWQAGYLTVGDFGLIQAYLIRIFTQLWSVGRYVRKLYENLAEAEEMTEVLVTPHEIIDRADAGKLVVSKGIINFDHVDFGYPNQKKIFDDFTLTIAGGERVALVGPSGGGKSTITKLLFRFYDLNSGTIRIDDQNIAAVTQDSLRDNLALVPQDPILFHRSLIENIRYARPEATNAEVVRAAKLAHCHEFIERFPEKYETYVGERGVKLSGGERQRVAIARAILKDAPILVLDEATSSLDSESEFFIQDALRKLMKQRTTIVIAHRLSTIMQMDRILVIEKGKIIEEGKHEELVKAKQGTYQRLWQIQAGGFS